MDGADSRSEQRPGLRLHDGDEGTECDAGSGLRLRRNVLRRSNLEAGQLKNIRHSCGKAWRICRRAFFARRLRLMRNRGLRDETIRRATKPIAARGAKRPKPYRPTVGPHEATDRPTIRGVRNKGHQM